MTKVWLLALSLIGCGGVVQSDTTADDTEALTNTRAASGGSTLLDWTQVVQYTATGTTFVSSVPAGAADKRFTVNIKKGQDLCLNMVAKQNARLYMAYGYNPTPTQYDWHVELTGAPSPFGAQGIICVQANVSADQSFALYAPSGTLFQISESFAH